MTRRGLVQHAGEYPLKRVDGRKEKERSDARLGRNEILVSPAENNNDKTDQSMLFHGHLFFEDHDRPATLALFAPLTNRGGCNVW
jgi:hypothetical protein